jgi:hypothetical protein
MIPPTAQFTVKIKGDDTGRLYEGMFTVRVKTSHLDTLRQDEIRRATLGASPNEAGARAMDLAHAYAFCVVRLKSGKDEMPAWFKECNYGLEADDPNVLIEVNNAAYKAVEKARGVTAADAEKVLEELRKKGDGDGAAPPA